MPKVTLTYFNVKGLGEGIRMLLAYGGQEFEDNRVIWGTESWPELKPKTPFRLLPVLEIDGKEYAQSLAISRFLGHKYGLAGATAEEDLVIDQNVEFFTDIRIKAARTYHEPNEEIKKIKQEELVKNEYPYLLSRVDQMIKENNGYLAAGKLTWADFAFAGFYDTMKVLMQMPDLDEKYPSFKKLTDTVTSLPKVKEYCDAAPKAAF